MNHIFLCYGWVIKMLNNIFMNVLFFLLQTWIYFFVVVVLVVVIMKYEQSFFSTFVMLNPEGKFYGWATAWRCYFFSFEHICSIKFFGNTFWHYLVFILPSLLLFYLQKDAYLLTYRLVVLFFFFLSFFSLKIERKKN